jgi:hypothetical protein
MMFCLPGTTPDRPSKVSQIMKRKTPLASENRKTFQMAKCHISTRLCAPPLVKEGMFCPVNHLAQLYSILMIKSMQQKYLGC